MSHHIQTLLAHPGTQYSLHLARELHRYGSLGSLHTCMVLRGESILTKCIAPLAAALGADKQFQNRTVCGIPAKKVQCYPTLEFKTWYARRTLSAYKALCKRNELFQNQISSRAIEEVNIVIGFDTSSRILAERAREAGKMFILDRSIAHSRTYAQIADELKERYPKWQDISVNKAEINLQSEDREHELAHIIVAPSHFVAQTLIDQGVPPERVRVNPFGTDTAHFSPSPSFNSKGKLIFLFVGALTARKGLPLLLQAWSNLQPKKAELWIVGAGYVPDEVRREAPDSVHWHGAVSRRQLPRLFQQAHVFVFPSFFEGLAQVQLEAAACALPIIATTASGGDDVVEEGQTGFVITPGDIEQLEERMSRFIEQPTLASQMHERAKKLTKHWNWTLYGNRWQRILEEVALC